MRFMMFVCTDPQAEPYVEAEDTYAEWDALLKEKGILLYKQRLRPPQDATTVRVRRHEVLVTDGPFAESKEWIAGIAILECRNRAEAMAWAALHPMARFGRLEVREFWSFGDPPPIPAGTEDLPDGYLQLVCTDPDADPYDPALDNIEKWVESVKTTGQCPHGDRLRPVEHAKTVRVRQGELLVTDGPFAETKEWVAGYDVLRCANLDEAIEVASRHPMARFGRLELRPFWPR